MKNKTVAAVLAFFLGMWGVHRFYLGQKFLGFLYFFFFWVGFIATIEEGGAPFFLPVVILAFIDSILLAVKPEEEFDATYNKKTVLERRPGVRRGTSVTLADFKAEGVRFFREHDYECALDAFLDALDLAPDDPTVHFNLACAYARLYELPDTLHHLELAIDYGFDRKERLDNHPAFEWVRNQPEWQEFKINDYRVEPQAFPRDSDMFPSPKAASAPQQTRPTPVDAPAPDLPTEEPDTLEQFDLLEQIARLGELRNRGVLTEEEFARQKEKLLN